MSQTNEINLDSLGLPELDLERQDWGVPDKTCWRVEGKFRQTDLRAKTSTLFQRFNRHYLLIQGHRKTKALPERVLDLTFVEQEPREIRDYHPKLWFAAGLLVAVSAVAGFVFPLSLELLAWLSAPLTLALALGALAHIRRRHCYEFVALNSDVVLFTVNALGTDPDKVSAFVDTLRKAIAYGQRQLPDGKRRIPLAVSAMRRLSEEEVITKGQYERIKRHWFGF